MKIKIILIIFLIAVSSADLSADTKIEIGTGAGFMWYDVLKENSSNSRYTVTQINIILLREAAGNFNIGAGIDSHITSRGFNNGSRSLIGFRAFYTEYFIMDFTCVSLFAGICRLSREEPAYGYYAGAGLRAHIPQWNTLIGLEAKEGLSDTDNVPGVEHKYSKECILSLSASYYLDI